MFSYLDPITEGLNEDSKKKIIKDLAQKINKFGMDVPAVILLESFKYFAVVGSFSILLFSSPILSIFGIDGYKYTSFFKDRKNIENLLREIEAIEKSKLKNNVKCN